MIIFDEINEVPDGLQGKGAETAEKSLYVWRALYGPLNRSKDHILLGHFGLVPVDYLARVGYIWLAPATTTPSRKALQESKRAFTSFLNLLPWTTYVYTEIHEPRHARFAEFMGFRHALDVDGYHFFERPSDVN